MGYDKRGGLGFLLLIFVLECLALMNSDPTLTGQELDIGRLKKKGGGGVRKGGAGKRERQILTNIRTVESLANLLQMN